MTLDELVGKSCLIGLSYFNVQGETLKQSQLCGKVVAVNTEEGISIELLPAPASDDNKTAGDNTGEKNPIFNLPPTLTAWFDAPKGAYRDSETGTTITDPDYLVTWDVRQTKDPSGDREHVWWKWDPRTEPPQVG